ncbi:mechanosensitive ion channel domain-containing protein [Tranquillimonas rosea]|uniref:mechanosensitive ion channel domain-containing protein n=1 Tax=Tranquillimonas rosea TaxID=641238 RepID=UPI003BAAA45D
MGEMFFRRVLAALVLVTALALAPFGAATAQTAEGTPSESEAPEASPAQALIDILQDDSARTELIDELQRIAEDGAEEQLGSDTPLTVPTEETSIGRQLAELTQEVAQTAAGQAASLWQTLTQAPDAFDGLDGSELGVLLEAFGDLLLAIVITVVLFIVLRRLAIPFYRRMGASADRSGLVRTVLIFIASAVIEVVVVVLAWAIGYAAILAVLGEFGQIGIRQSLYLNAFLAVELVKVAIRLVLSPATGGLRLVPLGDAAAQYLSRRANLVVGVLGYGFLLIVPILNQSVSYSAGRSFSALLSVIVILFVAGLVIARRKAVSGWLMAEIASEPEPGEADPEADAEETLKPPRRRTGPAATLAQAWHWLALGYLAVMMVIVLSRPTRVVFDALWGSAKVVLVLFVGVALSGMLARAIARGITLPEDVNAKLPLLEKRLNQFVPKTLTVVRVLILIVGLAVICDVVGLLDFSAWLDGDVGARVLQALFSVAGILIVAFALWLALTSWVDYRLNAEYGRVPTPREQTLLTLLKNAATIALIILTLMFVLAEIGLNIGPLLASAGVLGLAIGFGAQKMVQDIITGVFIQFENAMNVGDVVTVGGVTGAVEKLTVRSVSLRDLQGVFHIIPFSSVDMVSNYMRDFSYHVADMGIAYREDYEEAKQAMFDAFDELRQDPEQSVNILGDLEWFGLNSFGDSAIVLRGRIKTVPGTQWGVGRAYNAVLKRVFDERGIEIPFPHQTIYFGEAKDGTSTKLRIAETHDDTADPVGHAPAGETREGEIDSRVTDAPQDGED